MTALPVPAYRHHRPRHAAPKFAHLRKAIRAVSKSVRIPKPLNAALDAVGRHPAVTLAASLLVLSVAVFAVRPDLSLMAVATAAAYALGSAQRRGKARRLLAENSALHVEHGRLTEQLRHVERGDASAPTAQLFTIPDVGDDR